MTKNTPKPLLEIKGRPMIEHIMGHIFELKEIDKVFVVTNSKFHLAFEQWAESFKSGVKIKIIDDLTTSNEERLGAVGDMNYAILEEKIDDDLLVIAGDNLFGYRLKDFYDYFAQKKATVVACKDMVSADEVRGKFGVVEVDKEGKITG